MEYEIPPGVNSEKCSKVLKLINAPEGDEFQRSTEENAEERLTLQSILHPG